ncbi:hypothetical protein ACFQ3V_06295 [Microbacterium lemovicicum]
MGCRALSPEEEKTMSSTAVSVDSSDRSDLDVDIQRDARAWSRFTGMKYTRALRLMKHPLAHGILGERISARKLIAVLTEHPVLSEPVQDDDDTGAFSSTGERATLLGRSGLWADETYPIRMSSEDSFIELVLVCEVLRMFSTIDEPTSDAYSYNLKHTAEELFSEWLGKFSHVDNGIAIWAAAAIDLPMSDSSPGEMSPNANFGLDPQQVEYARRMRRNQRGSSSSIRAHHHRPPGYLYLQSALEQFRTTAETPARWNGVDEQAEPLTSPFHEWLVAQVDPSGERGDFGSRENLAYDYRAGVLDNDHGVAMHPQDLVRILVDLHAAAEFVDAAREAVLDWARTSPDSQGIRTELIDEERSSHGGWGAGDGTIERFEYRCPCGNGTILEEHDNIPGFREHSPTIMCSKCDKEWQQVPGAPAYGWRIEPIERAVS